MPSYFLLFVLEEEEGKKTELSVLPFLVLFSQIKLPATDVGHFSDKMFGFSWIALLKPVRLMRSNHPLPPTSPQNEYSVWNPTPRGLSNSASFGFL